MVRPKAMSKLVEKERRRDAVRLHLENDHLIAIGHVAARAAMLDMMIELAVEALSKSYPSRLSFSFLYSDPTWMLKVRSWSKNEQVRNSSSKKAASAAVGDL
jgi:hypothetical protein